MVVWVLMYVVRTMYVQLECASGVPSLFMLVCVCVSAQDYTL